MSNQEINPAAACAEFRLYQCNDGSWPAAIVMDGKTYSYQVPPERRFPATDSRGTYVYAKVGRRRLVHLVPSDPLLAGT